MKIDVKAAVAGLAARGWKPARDKIAKAYKFKSFSDTMRFMMRTALEIERIDHHPEWANVYDEITVSLTTHSEGGVTMKDVELAGIMDKIAAGFID